MRKIVKYYKPYLVPLLIAVVLLFLQAQCELALPDYMSKIVSEGIAVSNMSYIIKNGGLMLLLTLANVACAVLVGYIASRVGSASSRDMRNGVFEKVSDFSGAEFDRFTVSSLITRSTNDITQIQMFVIMLIRVVIYAPMMGVGGVIKAVDKSRDMPAMGLVIAVAVGVLLLAIALLLIVVQPKFMKIQKLIDKLNLVSRESLTGMMVIRAFHTQKHEEERFDSVNKELTDINLFVNRAMVLMMPIMTLIMNGVSVAVAWVAASSANNVTDVGNMMAFMQYAMQIIMSFVMMSMSFVMMPRAIVSGKRVNEVLSSEIAISDKKDARQETLKGNLEFHDVSFSYPGSEDRALHHISFTAKPGQTTAIIGSTGSGKSTLIQLIPRLYDATEGAVTIDGIDVRDMSRDSLRGNIGYVPQKNVLFAGTIASNLKYGDREASDEKMQEAAAIAQATEFISSKPDGFEESIAQGGANVSGGQKQRLAIARALVKDACIYVFDDSFSALDFKTDAALRKALKETTQNKTVLIVAQRVGTIMGADNILVLDEGRIVGMGTHKELLQTCSVYHDIAHSQLSEEELQ